MRKIVLTVLLAASSVALFAQKLDDVQEKIAKGKYDEAKEKIDKFLAEPKNQDNANAWYYKGKIYAELARLDSTQVLTYDAGAQALEAFKKYHILDKKAVMTTLDQNVGLFVLYDMYYNQGIKAYNDKDYAKAYDRMKRALEVEDYIAKNNFSYNNFSFPALDTQLINLTASSAYLAKMEDESIPYFEKLANARLSGKEYKEVYGLLAEYYYKRGDAAKGDKYVAAGREFFPDNDYWVTVEFGNPGTDTLKRFARYEQMLQKYPGNYALAMDYGIELFNYTYTWDKKPADYAARQERTQKALEEALESNPGASLPNFVMAQHIYNQIYDLEEAHRAIRGTTASDVAKKKDLTAKINSRFEDLHTYAVKAYDAFVKEGSTKMQDKMNKRKMAEALRDYYEKKKDTANATKWSDTAKSIQ